MTGLSASAQPRQYALAAFAAATEPTIVALRGAAERLEADANLLEQLDRPELAFAEGQALLGSVLPAQAPLTARNLLSTMLERSDLATLPSVVEHLSAMASGGPAARVAVVTTAMALGQSERDALAEKVRGAHGDDLGFVFETDPAILGGATIRIGDRVIDGSVAAKLSALGASLLTPH